MGKKMAPKPARTELDDLRPTTPPPTPAPPPDDAAPPARDLAAPPEEAAVDPEQLPDPEPIERVELHVPLGPLSDNPSRSDRPIHLEVRLDRDQSRVLRMLLAALDAHGVRLTNGRRVTTDRAVDGVRWLLDQLAESERAHINVNAFLHARQQLASAQANDYRAAKASQR